MLRNYREFAWLIVSMQLVTWVAHSSDRMSNGIEQDMLCGEEKVLAFSDANNALSFDSNRLLILGNQLRSPLLDVVCIGKHRNHLLPTSLGNFPWIDLSITPTDSFALGVDNRLPQSGRIALQRLGDNCWSWPRSEFVICGIPRWLLLF